MDKGPYSHFRKYFWCIKSAIESARFYSGPNKTKLLKNEEGITEIITTLIKARAEGKKLMFIGNGGSAAICSHMAIDFSNTAKISSICFNDGALLTCFANDYGFENIFAKAVEGHGREGDVLIAISSSGNSEDVLRGVAMAKTLGCKVITFSGFQESNNLVKLGDINVFLPAEPKQYGTVEVGHYMMIHFILDYMNKENPA